MKPILMQKFSLSWMQSVSLICSSLPTTESSRRKSNVQTGQVYANAGFEVVAVNPDRYMSTEEAQELYDYERRVAFDCFGPGERGDY